MKFFKKNKNKKETKDIKLPLDYNIVTDNSPFYVKEAYKSLRTNIMFTLENETSKAILITSSLSNEGKSTISINAAITFAQTGSKIVLVDCDLRKPKTHTYMNLPNKSGLSNILGGFAKLDDVITPTAYGFDCITSGHIPPNPSELLSSNRMIDLIAQLRQRYDYIFLDTPPVNMVTDTCTIGKLVDGAIFVVKCNSTTNADVDAAVSALNFSETKILGFVFNSSPVAGALGYQKRIGYKKYYSYKKYGYSKRKYGYGGYRSGYGGGYGGYGSYGRYGDYGYSSSSLSKKIEENEIPQNVNKEK